MPAVAAPPAPASTSATLPTGTGKPAAAAPTKPAAVAPATPAAPAKPADTRGKSMFEDEDFKLPPEVDADPADANRPAGDAPLKSVDDAPAGTDDPDKAPTGATTPDGLPKPGDPAPEPRTNRELKKVYESNKKALKLTESRVKELEARVAELDGVATTAKADTGPLAEQLAAAQKRIDDYEGRLRLKAYEESDEFKSKHLAPFKRSEARAFNDVRQLEYIEGLDEETQQPRVRAATDADFIQIYQLPTGKAYAEAKRRFGDSAQLVMSAYHDLHRQQDDMRDAIAEYRAKGVEMETKTQAQAAQEREASDRMWRTANQDLQSRYFLDLKLDADDPEMKELLTKSYATVDKLFSGNGTLTLAERVGLQASVRQRAALFGATRRQLVTVQKELAEAKKTIEELRGSAPGKPRPKSDSPPVGEFKSIGEEMAGYQMET